MSATTLTIVVRETRDGWHASAFAMDKEGISFADARTAEHAVLKVMQMHGLAPLNDVTVSFHGLADALSEAADARRAK